MGLQVGIQFLSAEESFLTGWMLARQRPLVVALVGFLVLRSFAFPIEFQVAAFLPALIDFHSSSLGFRLSLYNMFQLDSHSKRIMKDQFTNLDFLCRCEQLATVWIVAVEL